MVAARPEDDLDDLFPGTGAVTNAWRTWRLKFALPDDGQIAHPRSGRSGAARSVPGAAP
jgi:hypothetical protein